MSEKHYPYYGGNFDRIIFDKDGSVWVPEAENDRLRGLVQDYDKVLASMNALCDCDFVPLCDGTLLALRSRMYDLGIEVE